MEKTALYMIDYEYRGRSSFAFDRMHQIDIVEAPENISFKELDKLCFGKIPGFWNLNDYRQVNVIKLV